MIKRLERGQALIEALLALSAAAVTVAVVTFLVINALSDTSFARAQTVAAGYAKEGLEWARTQRDQNYLTFKNAYVGNNVTYCLNPVSQSSPLSSGACPSANLDGLYKRQLTFSSTAASCSNGTQVTSSVAWTDSQCSAGNFCHNVTLYSCLATDNSLNP